jgi:hypothetical protein
MNFSFGSCYCSAHLEFDDYLASEKKERSFLSPSPNTLMYFESMSSFVLVLITPLKTWVLPVSSIIFYTSWISS